MIVCAHCGASGRPATPPGRRGARRRYCCSREDARRTLRCIDCGWPRYPELYSRNPRCVSCAHKARLVGVECATCGKAMNLRPSETFRRFCSRACQANRPWRVKGTLRACVVCGKDFFVRHKGNRCCSRSCGITHTGAIQKAKYAPHPVRTCVGCARTFQRKLGGRNKGLYCTRACAYRHHDQWQVHVRSVQAPAPPTPRPCEICRAVIERPHPHQRACVKRECKLAWGRMHYRASTNPSRRNGRLPGDVYVCSCGRAKGPYSKQCKVCLAARLSSEPFDCRWCGRPVSPDRTVGDLREVACGPRCARQWHSNDSIIVVAERALYAVGRVGEATSLRALRHRYGTASRALIEEPDAARQIVKIVMAG
jgi:hypothetical protein